MLDKENELSHIEKKTVLFIGCHQNQNNSINNNDQ